MSSSLAYHRRLKSSEGSAYIRSSPANDIAISFEPERRQVLQRSRYNNANAFGDELETRIAHEIRNDVLHEGNLKRGPPQHFASAMLHQMHFDVDFGDGTWDVCGFDHRTSLPTTIRRLIRHRVGFLAQESSLAAS